MTLELLNGNWGIAAAALMVICAVYLRHEAKARHILPFGERRRLTDGIKVAIATFTMSLGVLIRSAETWRALVTDTDLHDSWLLIGGAIGVIGFLCLIREKSLPLFGRAPWVCTLAAMAIFTAGSIGYRIFIS